MPRSKPITGMLGGIGVGIVLAISVPSLAAGDAGSAPYSGQPLPALATLAPDAAPRTVTVSGSATVTTSPDEAIISLGVQTEASSAEDALHENASRMLDVLRALAGLDLKEDDVATTGVSLYPTYNSSGTSIAGYQASNTISVTFHDLSVIGKAIDAAVEAGANLSSGITFQMSDANRGDEQALAAAVADARSKATAMAAASDAQLGQVVSVAETSSPVYYPPMPYYAEAGAADMAVSTPVDPPTLQTQVTVQVSWELI